MPVLAQENQPPVGRHRDHHDTGRGIDVVPVAFVAVRHHRDLADEPLRLGHQDLSLDEQGVLHRASQWRIRHEGQSSASFQVFSTCRA